MQASISYVFSILLYVILALLSYVLKLDPWISFIITWGILLVSIFLVVKNKLYYNIRPALFPLICMVAMTIVSLSFISLSLRDNKRVIPDPQPVNGNNYEAFNVKVLNVAKTNANDNYIPYRQAQFMVNHSDPGKDSFIDEWGVHFFQRTPLMGAVTANYFNIFFDNPPIAYTWSSQGQDPENTYLKFQVIAHIMNSLFLIPAFFIIEKIFNRKSAMLAALFILINPFFLYNSFFSWPKSLVAFFILVSWLLLFYNDNKKSNVILAGITAGLAYLSHDLAILYIGTAMIVLLLKREFFKTLLYGVVSLLWALPWLAISKLYYDKPSSFLLYPFSLKDIPQSSQSKQIINEFFSTPPLRIIAIKLESLFYWLSPYQLIYKEGGQGMAQRLWALTIFSIPGATGLGLLLPIIIASIKRIADIYFWVLVIMPVVFCTLIIGWPKGMGALHFAQTSVVLLIGIGSYYLVRLNKVYATLLAMFINLLTTAFFMLYSYYNNVSDWMNFTDIILLTIIIAILLSTLAATYLLALGKKISVNSTIIDWKTNY